jgi:hypothetical protein
MQHLLNFLCQQKGMYTFKGTLYFLSTWLTIWARNEVGWGSLKIKEPHLNKRVQPQRKQGSVIALCKCSTVHISWGSSWKRARSSVPELTSLPLSYLLPFFSHSQFLYFTTELVTTPKTIIVVLSMTGANWKEVVLFLMDCKFANSLKLPLVQMLDPISHLVTQTYPPIAGNIIVCTVCSNPACIS